jgi:4-amino-4-deoxy-L-arabinose transferase-like glycosyltransferase
MQIAALYLLYLIARRLLGDPWALGATMLLGLDTVFFIHGGTLLIDMPAFLFCFLAIELYFRKHYWTSASSMGLAFLAREMSIFYFLTLAVYHLGANWNWKLHGMKPALKLGVKYTLLALLIFGCALWAYDLHYLPPSSTTVTNVVNANIVLGPNGTAVNTIYQTSHSTSEEVMWNPIQHLEFIYHYHGPEGMNFANRTYVPYLYAWNWILPVSISPNLQVLFDPFNSPSYYAVAVDVSSNNTVTHYIPIWYRAQANLALWYGIWPSILGLAWAFKQKKERLTALFLTVGIVANFAPWLALSLLVSRIGFNYYMIYTLPFIAMALAFTWKQLPEKYGKKVLALNVLAALVFFLYFFPVRPMP